MDPVPRTPRHWYMKYSAMVAPVYGARNWSVEASSAPLGQPTDHLGHGRGLLPNRYVDTQHVRLVQDGVEVSGMAATAVFIIYPIGQGSFSDGMPLGISGTFNFMLVFQAEYSTHNALKAHSKHLDLGCCTTSLSTVHTSQPP